MEELLKVKNLKYHFKTYGGEVEAVRGVSFNLKEGETLGIVGESGSGKSVTAQSILRLNQEPPGVFKSGNIEFKGKIISGFNNNQMRDIRGREISMIFQDPMTSLNPTMKIGKQITEMLKKAGFSKKESIKRAYEVLDLVKIENPKERFNQYPFEFSGGMLQRVMIAIALSTNPSIIIADEPTTSLDVTIEAQILNLLKKLKKELNKSLILISHNLGIISSICDRIAVMYGGKIIEIGKIDDIFYNSKHPYTWGLLKSIPKPDMKKTTPLLPIEGSPPDLFSPPKGCPFAPRCEFAMKICYENEPNDFKISEFHKSNCWLQHSKSPNITIEDYESILKRKLNV